MKPLTSEWVEKAEGDMKVAEDQWQNKDPVYDAVCFHCQQCAEKYLKAWLVENGQAPVRTHDLEALAKQCLLTLPELAALLNPLRFLTSSAVEIRYPGASASCSDAEQCLDAAMRTRHLIRSKLLV